MLKYHIKRFWWAWAALAVSFGWPVIMWKMQTVEQRLEPETMRAVAGYYDQYVAKMYPIRLDEHQAGKLANQFDSMKIESCQFSRFIRMKHDGAAWGDILDSDLDFLERHYGDGIDSYLDIIRQRAVFYVPEEQMFESVMDYARTSPDDVVDDDMDWFWFNQMHDLHQALNRGEAFLYVKGLQNIAEKRWDEAVQNIDDLAHIPWLMLPLFDNQPRIVWNNYEFVHTFAANFITRDTPPEVDEKVWRALAGIYEEFCEKSGNMEATNRSNRMLWMFLMAYQQADRPIPYGDQDIPYNSTAAAAGVIGYSPFLAFDNRFEILLQSSNIKNPVLREWPHDIKQTIDEESKVNWTTVPALRKWHHLMCEMEPEAIMPESGLALLDQVDDPEGLSLIIGPNRDELPRYYVDYVRWGPSSRIPGAIELGFACRVYHNRTGQWPDNLDGPQLRNLYTETFGDKVTFPLDRKGHEKIQYSKGPIQDSKGLRRLIENVVVAGYYDLYLNEQDGVTVAEWKERGGRGALEPSLTVALAQGMRRHPELLKNIKVEMRRGDGEWQVLTAEMAGKMARESNAESLRWALDEEHLQGKPILTETMEGYEGRRTVKLPDEIRIRAEVVWPRGEVIEILPDGRDYRYANYPAVYPQNY